MTVNCFLIKKCLLTDESFQLEPHALSLIDLITYYNHAAWLSILICLFHFVVYECYVVCKTFLSHAKI